MKRIGILTGGGDCPGLNAVIRAVTKSALARGFEVVGYKDGFEGLILNQWIPLDQAMVSGILVQGGTILGTSNTANPYRWAVQSSKGRIRFQDVSRKAVSNYRKLNLHGLIVVGGDGTMSIANRLHKDGVPIVGIPKTIDNDLAGTDVTFGFETAVVTAAEAIDKVHTTAQAHHRAMVVEVMGRYAGWIALYAGVASGGDVILIPEIPFQMKHVYKKILERNRLRKNFSIVVVAEGAKPKGGGLTITRRVARSTDPVRLGGVVFKIAADIEKHLKIESRAIVLGHVQRGGPPTPFDRLLATQFGSHAVHMVFQRDFGKMAVYKNNAVSSVLLEEAAAGVKLVPAGHHLIASARAVGTSFGDC